MNDTLQSLIDSLYELSNRIHKQAHNQNLTTYNSRSVPLDKSDLALMSEILADKLRKAALSDLKSDSIINLGHVNERVQMFITNSIPSLFGQQSATVANSLFSLLYWVNVIVEPMYNDWEHINKDLLPKSLNNKLKKIQSEINSIIPEKGEIEEKVAIINRASEIIESLPSDIEALEDASNKIDNLANESNRIYKDLVNNHSSAKQIIETLEERKHEAQKLIERCEDAYGLTTTIGLSVSFDNRASKLTWTVRYWIFGLILALGGGIWIGHERFEVVNEALTSSRDSNHIWILIFLSVLSLGAPIWFAWIATRQISERFKLSEDYAFKASVAKAYEGYRKEAVRIDPELEARLFGSALTRLEEAPLRLMDKQNYGSPWHELMNSPAFVKAVETIPGFKDKIFDIMKREASVKAPEPKVETKNEES